MVEFISVDVARGRARGRPGIAPASHRSNSSGPRQRSSSRDRVEQRSAPIHVSIHTKFSSGDLLKLGVLLYANVNLHIVMADTNLTVSEKLRHGMSRDKAYK